MKLNPKQQEAVDYSGGPLLIVAGAGSGKTKTLTSRVVKLIELGTLPNKICAITFTNKAAKEMADRITSSLSLKGKSVLPFIGTFHSLGARILRRDAKYLGRTPAFSIYDDSDSLSIIKKLLKNTSSGEKKYTAPQILKKISTVKNKLLNPKETLEDAVYYLYDAYEDVLRENNAFDFGDLITKPVVLFKNHGEVLLKYQNMFDHLLVDEYQDVNRAQYELVNLLAQRHKNLSAVGDDAQAIYGWRHADFKNFLNFEDDWGNAKIIFLEQNYRSTPTILSAASAVIKHNQFQKPKKLWTENDDGGTIHVIATSSQDEEAQYIVDHIREDLSPHISVAILYRTNAQSRAIETALIQEQIYYRIYGGIKFYDRKEIKDIIAAIRLASNPRDSVSADRILKTFTKAIGTRLVEDLKERGSKLSILEIIQTFLATTNYFLFLDRKFQNARERIENIDELISFASTFTELQPFLERVSLMQAIDDPMNPEDSSSKRKPIQLMSIHSAKGLEFDHVFVAGVSEGLLPHQMSYGTQQELEEERRLMYVAMTRARKSLMLSFSYLPSRFLYEIPPELTEFENLKNDSRELPDEDIVYID